MLKFSDVDDLVFSVTQRGNSFFHRGWVRAKGTKVYYTPEWGDLFITSEFAGYANTERLYTVRRVVQVENDGSERPITARIYCINVGPDFDFTGDAYQIWPTLAAAKKHLKAYQKHLCRDL